MPRPQDPAPGVDHREDRSRGWSAPPPLMRLGRTEMRAAELAARWAGVLTILFIAGEDVTGPGSWVVPVAVALQLVASALLLVRPPGARRLSGLVDLATLLLVASSASSAATQIGIFLGVSFWLVGQRPRWTTGLTAALAVGNTIAAAGSTTALMLAVAINGAWLTIAAGSVSSTFRAGVRRTRQLRASRDRLIEDALLVERRVLLTKSGELHDGPLQLLLVAAQELADDDADEAWARELVLRASRDMREILERSEPDDARELVQRDLEDWCRVLAARYGFAWRLEIDERLARVDAVSVAGARELVTNAARHAGGTRIDASIALVGDRTVVVVRDDGGGMADGTRTGFGLRALRRRVDAVAGSLLLVPHPSGGTVATLSVPLDPDGPGLLAHDPVLARTGALATLHPKDDRDRSDA